jgi:hypothetical protein
MCFLGWGVGDCIVLWAYTDISEEYAPSIFKVEEFRFINRDFTKKVVMRPKEKG